MSPPTTSLSISGTSSELLHPRLDSLLNATPANGTMDSLTVSFAEQAANPYSLTAMVAGGTLGRVLLGGTLAMGGSRSPLLITPLAETVGLAGEVATF